MSSGDKLSERMAKLVSWSKYNDRIFKIKEAKDWIKAERVTMNNTS